MIFLFNCFEATFLRNLISFITFSLAIVCILSGFNKANSGIMNFLAYFFLGSLGMGYILRIMQKVNIDSIENFMANNDQKIKFEMIVKNIEESLIIFDEEKMEHVNQQFLKLFKNIILEIHKEIQVEEDEDHDGEFKSKVNLFRKNI